MNFFSKLFTPPDPETEKQTAFENIERVYEGDKVINQQKASWLTMRGNNYGVRGKLDMAISDFKEALGYEPNRPSTLVSLGGTYTHNKMWKDGIAILEKAENFLSHIEDDAMREMEKQLLYYELGTAYFFSDNIKKSIANLSQSISSAVGLGVYKDCGDISTDEWAKISHAKRNAEQLLKKIKDTQNRNTPTIMRDPVDIDPPEYSGFGEFFATYYKDKSFTEQNRYILSIFPPAFWANIGVSFEDVSNHADVFFQHDEKERVKTIVKINNTWLTKHSINVDVAMKLATTWNRELMSNENFRNKCADIALAELQMLGIKMCALLPKDEQKKFLDECAEHYPPSVEPDFAFLALRVWADVVCTPLAEKHGLVQETKGDMIRIHLSDVIKEVGFIETIAWLRELPSYNNFDKHVQKSSIFLLDVQGVKNYIAFDSVFFPYIGKRR